MRPSIIDCYESAISMVVLSPQFIPVDGLSIRFAESEPMRGQAEQALLLSPWPESLYAFEPTWPRPRNHARLVSVDLPGFGNSEYSEALMSPTAMGDLIVRLADALDLKSPHVVAPDIGASATLFAAARHSRRFRSVVVGSGGAAVPIELSGVLNDWAEAPDLEPYSGSMAAKS
jgi:pimeloyl-ACP methyl ester carboxylesterase